MPILAIDTTLAPSSLALRLDNGKTLLRRLSGGQREAEDLVPVMGALMREGAAFAPSLDFKNLTKIAVARGPGPFMRLRAGLAAARALSFSLDVPLLALSTCKILAHASAQTLPMTSEDKILTALPAPHGKGVFQLFSPSGNEETPLMNMGEEEAAKKFKAIFSEETEGTLYLTGPKAPCLDGLLEGRHQLSLLQEPLALPLAQMAFASPKNTPSFQALPLYLEGAAGAPPPRKRASPASSSTLSSF